MKYYDKIKKDASEGRIANYYTFWIMITLIIGTAIITPIYLYYPTDSLISKFIFVILFVTISLTNFQALAVAVDYARRSEPQMRIVNLGTIFIGTIMDEFLKDEERRAAEEKRDALKPEDVAKEFARGLITMVQTIQPLQKELKDRGVTVEKIANIANSVIQSEEKIRMWAIRFEKLYPILDVLAESATKIEPKILGRVIGYQVAKFAMENKEVKKID